MSQMHTNRWLRWLGGGYIPLILLLTLLAWLPFLGIAIWALIANAELSLAEIQQMLRTGFPLYAILSMMVAGYLHLATRQTQRNLDAVKKGEFHLLSANEIARGWKEITSLPQRYAIAAALAGVVHLVIAYTQAQRYPFITQERHIYLILAMVPGLTAAIMGSILLVESLIRPAVVALKPADFALQIAALRPRLRLRWLAVILGLLLTSLLLLAPIGYHQTYTVLYREIGSSQVLRNLQVQSIAVTVGMLILGAIYAYGLTGQTQRPIRRLIESFQQVERGDLSQRVPVESTDELGLLSVYFNRMLAELQSFRETLEAKIETRTAQLQAVNDVGHTASAILDPGELMQRVVDLISERFDYYYAAIFLLDENGEWAELKAASGEAGKILLQRRHRLPLNERSMVSAAIRLKQARIALDVGDEAVRFDNPFLPYTRSEIALPLIVGDRILGALDVQSTKEAAFAEEDINTLQGMANQVAVALSNAQTFQEMKRALEELQAFQRQYLLSAWEDVAASRGDLQYQVGEEVSPEEGDQLRVPLSLRDQILGEIIIAGDDLDDDDRAWAEAIATQAVVALENARLLEESQRTALRERLIAEISQKIWSARTMENVLKTAVQELGQALQAAEVSIELDAEGETTA